MATYLVAPDSFKGSLDASQFCQIATQTIQAVDPQANVIARPMSDGGEGFLDSFAASKTTTLHSAWVSGPLGKKTKAQFAWQASTQTAIIEMAQASGITKIRRAELNPLNTHTYGTGQLIQKAIDMGAKKIIIGLGGSASNDGGVGALMALGVTFEDADQLPINLGGQALKNLANITHIPQHLLDIEWQMACDVTNPLLGEQGATYVFGPQKGAQSQHLDILEKALTNLASQLEIHSQQPIHLTPGSGAAGGMAASFMGLLNAKLTPGFDILNESLQLKTLIESQAIDYIITGEGRIDNQTRFGKLPLRIAELGHQHSIPTIGICGSLNTSLDQFPEFTALFSIANKAMDESESMANAPYLLQQTLHSVIRLLK